jgi:hypothetical protein
VAAHRRAGRTIRPAVHRTILVADMAGFGDRNRTNLQQIRMRDGLYRALEYAFRRADIPWVECYREDRGDGVFVLVPAEIPKGVLVESVPDALAEALYEHNRAHHEAQIRLRVALHAGEVNYDDHGVTAGAINLAFRLVNAHRLKVALDESRGVLGIIASSWFYEEVVRNSSAGDPMDYRRIRVAVKETRTTGWICVSQTEPLNAPAFTRPQLGRVLTQLMGGWRGAGRRRQR